MMVTSFLTPKEEKDDQKVQCDLKHSLRKQHDGLRGELGMRLWVDLVEDSTRL